MDLDELIQKSLQERAEEFEKNRHSYDAFYGVLERKMLCGIDPSGKSSDVAKVIFSAFGSQYFGASLIEKQISQWILMGRYKKIEMLAKLVEQLHEKKEVYRPEVLLRLYKEYEDKMGEPSKTWLKRNAIARWPDMFPASNERKAWNAIWELCKLSHLESGPVGRPKLGSKEQRSLVRYCFKSGADGAFPTREVLIDLVLKEWPHDPWPNQIERWDELFKLMHLDGVFGLQFDHK